MKRCFRIKGIPFVVTYDEEYGTVDTIDRNGQRIASNHRDAKRILNHADRIRDGVLPTSWRWERISGK